MQPCCLSQGAQDAAEAAQQREAHLDAQMSAAQAAESRMQQQLAEAHADAARHGAASASRIGSLEAGLAAAQDLLHSHDQEKAAAARALEAALAERRGLEAQLQAAQEGRCVGGWPSAGRRSQAVRPWCWCC